MYPYLDMAKYRHREDLQRAAEYRLAASIPRCRRQRIRSVLNGLDHVLHHTPRPPRTATVCCA